MHKIEMIKTKNEIILIFSLKTKMKLDYLMDILYFCPQDCYKETLEKDEWVNPPKDRKIEKIITYA